MQEDPALYTVVEALIGTVIAIPHVDSAQAATIAKAAIAVSPDALAGVSLADVVAQVITG
ncbi:hypothetical protein D3C71_1817560 [compost metagenome]